MPICLQDMDEDVVIALTAKNPQAPQNVVRFDYTTGEYLSVKLNETMIDHMEIESSCWHKDSPEGKAQVAKDGGVVKNGDINTLIKIKPRLH